MLWDPVLKKNLLKFVLASPVNSARDPHKNANALVCCFQCNPNIHMVVLDIISYLQIKSRCNNL